MPISTNCELIYDPTVGTSVKHAEWPARIVLKKKFVSGTEVECTFVPESSVTSVTYAPNDILFVDWAGKLVHVGHIA